MAQLARFFIMKTYKNLYPKIYDKKNLVLAWKKARKGKTKKDYVIEFEKEFGKNLKRLYFELKFQIYKPKPLQTFILRDPKTRVISKSNFRDRIVHHALCNIIEPIFDKCFIYDSCANRKKKGNLLAIKRFNKFMKKVSKNGKLNGWFNENQIKGYCFKADIKHYFQEVSHNILLKIIKRKIKDKRAINLIYKILKNNVAGNSFEKGMPLGNLTSQFFANVYLNELDYFIKHELKAKYYIRYVDDFVLLSPSKKQLKLWKNEINVFLRNNLELGLHVDKSRIINLSQGIDFVGFRNFYYHRLLRKRNIREMNNKLKEFQKRKINEEKLEKIFQGWNAYAKWANSYKIKKKFEIQINNLINTY